MQRRRVTRISKKSSGNALSETLAGITSSYPHSNGIGNDERRNHFLFRKRKILQRKILQWKSSGKKCSIRFILFVLLSLLILKLATRVLFSNPKTSSSSSHPYRNEARDSFVPADLDHELYQRVYDVYQESRDEKQQKRKHVIDGRNNGEISLVRSLDTYGEEVLERTKCDVTVLFMDPRFPHFQRGHPAFFALESVGKFLPNACVLIQTSKCSIDMDELRTDERITTLESAIYQRIYDTSLPLFQDMISQGRVRVTFLNHTKYNLQACDDYANPSSAMMNIHYWSDVDVDVDEDGTKRNGEYIKGVDSDTVLVMQDDSVICHEMDMNLYKNYAYVGGVFRKIHPFIAHHKLCSELFLRWAYFLGKKKSDGPEGLEQFRHFCSGDGSAPIGNGGFSLRSRAALRKAIETCPSDQWSGIDKDVEKKSPNASSAKCEVIGSINEDIYFATVLKGTGAEMPSAFDAALFSVEQLWPEESLDQYGGPEEYEERERIVMEASGIYRGSTLISAGRRSWWNFGIAKDIVHRDDTVPFGLHKPWWYFETDLLQSEDLNDQCPLLQYMFHPRDSRAAYMVKNLNPLKQFWDRIKKKIQGPQMAKERDRMRLEFAKQRQWESHKKQTSQKKKKKKKKKKKLRIRSNIHSHLHDPKKHHP